MYRSSWIRIAVFTTLGIAAVLSPGYGGWQFGIDAWLWAGVRDLVSSRFYLIPLGASAVMVAAEIGGAWLPSTAWVVRRPGRWAIAIAVAAGIALWLLRVRRWFGDLHGVDHESLQTWTIEAAEPLGALTQYYIQNAAIQLGWSISTAVALVTTVLGAAAVGAMFLWARLVTQEWPLVFAMLVSSGFMVMFCGYPEKGTPKALALICWYLFLTMRGLRRPRVKWVVPSSLALSVAVMMHGSGLCFLPAHLWVVWRRTSWRGATVAMLAFLAPFIPLIIYMRSGAPIAGGPWGNIAAPWQWFKQYCITGCGYDFWSVDHGMDVLNSFLMLSPVAFFCWPEALAHSRNTETQWLALGAAACVFLSIIWFPVLGFIPDWDIFALAPLAISYHAAFVGATVMPPRSFRRLAAAWIAGSAVHTAVWWRFFHLNL